MVELLVVEFDQVKYEEFLSSGSKSPRARQYSKISLGTRSQVRSEIHSDATDKKSAMANHITRNTRVNVSYKTREVGVADIQPIHACILPQFQVTGGFQQPVRCNWNAEHRQRQRARQLQPLEAGAAIYPADTECEAQARASFELRQTHKVRVWRPKREAL